MPYERATSRALVSAGIWYFVWTLIFVPIESTTLASPLAFGRSILIRLAIIVAFMVVSHLYIGTQDVVFDSIVPRTFRPDEPAPFPDDEAKPPVPRLAVRDRRILAIAGGGCMVYRLCSNWPQLLPSHFTFSAAYAWGWSIFVSVCFAIVVRSLFFRSDPTSGELRPAVKANLVTAFTLYFLGIDLARHSHALLHLPSSLFLILACIRHALSDLFLGATAALAVRVFEAAIKGIPRSKALSFVAFAAALFGIVIYWDRQGLLAVQPGGATITRFIVDLVFTLITALFLHGRLVRSLAPIEIPSIVPHQPDSPPGQRNSAAASGV